MAVDTGFLNVSLRDSSSNIVASGMVVGQSIDASQLQGIDFFVDHPTWAYDSTTDTVFLVEQSTDQAVALTRVGNHFRWSVGANDLGGFAAAPGSSVNKTAYVMVVRDSGTARLTLTSKTFTVTLDRRRSFYPTQIAGCQLWATSWRLTEAAGATVQTWDDASPQDADLTQASAGLRPTKRATGEGRPYLEFDGIDDLLATTLASFSAPCTIAVVARLRAVDATVRGIVQVGGTNGPRIAFDNANLKGISGSDVANTALPATNVWFVVVATKAAAGNVTIQLNLTAPVTGVSTAAVTAGTVQIADTAADAVAAVDVAEVAVWGSVLSAADVETVVNGLGRAYGVL